MAWKVWPQTYSHILSASQIEYMMELIYSQRSLEQQMENQHRFILLTDEGSSVGFASYSKIVSSVFKLQKIYVLPLVQGRGGGKLLIDHIIQTVQSEGARALRLNVNRHNKALFFYEKLGFEVIAEEDIDIGNGFFMNDFVMEKKLI